MPSWTKEQEQAINECGHNIIVSAGAGSGKTAVLSERVITNLKKGMHVNEMLLLTFTKAAAGEMRERIRKKIKKESSLVKELDLIDTAYITTFDSFALSIVKKFHYLLNVSNNIGIVDASIINIKKKEILDSIIDSYYNNNMEFLRLINDFCVKDDKDIRDSIMNISNKLDMLSDKNKYLDDYMNIYFDLKKIDSDIDRYISLIKDKIKEIKNNIEEISFLVDSEYYEKLLSSVSGLLNANSYEEIVSNLNIKLPIVPRGSDDEVKVIKENINNLIKGVKELCIYGTVDEIRDSILSTRDYVKVICRIIKEFTNKVQNYKYERDIYEFNDIAIMAIRVLKENENIRKELKYFFKEIMIDEYQDTNDLQEEFISMIENDNVYMVGDIKQSIYRFRNANPSIFKDKYDNYGKHNGGEKIDLNKNFRSRMEVLDNINVIFNMIMDDDIGGADYINTHQMVFGNNTYIDKGTTGQNNDFEVYNYNYERGSLFNKEEIEAFIIANDIKNKVGSKYKIFDKDEMIIKDISYNDFVILMDRTSSFELYKKVFEYLHIPLTLYKDEKMNEDNDILVIKNLVNLIIKVKNRCFDREFKYWFTSILRSFLYRVSDEEIFGYITNNTYMDSDLYKKCLNISNNLDNMSNRKLLESIICEFDYYDKLISIGNIQGNMIKVDKLFDMCDNLSDLGYSVYDFGNYLQEIIDNNYEMKYSVNSNKGNSVKIMTIHKSKGLEYHVCYYSGLYKTFNISDLKERFVYDKNYGIITPYFDEGIGSTIYKSLLREDYLKDEISEKIRLFYVALTRAKEKMIMLVPNMDDNSNSKLNQVLNSGVRSKYRSFLDIMNSIRNSISNYYTFIDIEKIGLTKDYDLARVVDYRKLIDKCDDKVNVKEISIDNGIIDSKSFSKKSNELISREVSNNINFGLEVHKILEYVDFNNINSYDGKYKEVIGKFLNQDIMKNVKSAKIYHEYEFIYEEDDVTYHGIIDLMCVYTDYIDIIDYKLKNINDDNYLKQLNGYKNYISNVTKKKVNIYLYSVLDNIIEEL